MERLLRDYQATFPLCRGNFILTATVHIKPAGYLLNTHKSSSFIYHHLSQPEVLEMAERQKESCTLNFEKEMPVKDRIYTWSKIMLDVL